MKTAKNKLLRRFSICAVTALMILGLAGIVAWVLVVQWRDRQIANLIGDLRSDDRGVRRGAALEVLVWGPLAGDAAPDLVAALKSEVASLSPENKKVEYVLSRDVVPFAMALWSTGNAGESGLLGLLDEDEVAIRLTTVMALSGTNQWFVRRDDEKDAVAVSVLRKALRDEDATVRWHACGGLGDLKQAGKSALPDLINLREADPDERVRGIVKVAMESIQ